MIPSEPSLSNRSSLRQTLKQRRAQLSQHQQFVAEQQVAQRIRTQLWFVSAHNIAVYAAEKGEISAEKIVADAWKMGKCTLLPVLHARDKRLLFSPFSAATQYRTNRFGLREPAGAKHTPAWALSVIILPLVGFTKYGVRLGMGGGFYDRTLSDLNPLNLRPLRVGLAYDFQQLDTLQKQPWDQCLDWVITPSRTIKCSEPIQNP